MRKFGLVAKLIAYMVMLIAVGYIGLDFVLSNLGFSAGSIGKLASAVAYFGVVGAVVGYTTPKTWWMAAIANWGAVVVAAISLTYSLTHLQGILMSIWPVAWVALSLAMSRLFAQLRLHHGLRIPYLIDLPKLSKPKNTRTRATA